MAIPRTVKAPRRRKKTRRKTAKRRVRAASVVAAPRRRRRKKAVKRKRVVRRRRVRAAVVAAPRRRRRKKSVRAWRGNSAGHSKAAKKGHRRRKARRAAPKRRRSRRAREVSEMTLQAPRRRRKRARRAAPRRRVRARRRSSMVMASRRVRALSTGGGIGSLLLTGGSLGLGFLIADGVDRLLATYNPSSTEVDKDKFRSDGAGTLGNVLNIGSRPGLVRAGAAVGAIAVPAAGAYYMRGRTSKTVLTAMAFGAGVNALKLLVNNVVMPMLRPKDSTPAELQKSYVARLYPSEVAAAINGAKKNPDGSERVPQLSASAGGGAGALSGSDDVGPFAGVGGGAEWPTAAQALNRGQIGGPGSDWPTLAQVLGTGGQYPTAQQALDGRVGWQPGPASTHGAGPQPAQKDCGCSKATPFLGFVDQGQSEDPLYR